MMLASPYSPLFTSGLLSSDPAPESLQSPISSLGPRRGSLPDSHSRASTSASTILSPRGDESSSFYFALQPRRDAEQLRSFLSLDLIESQSLRSASLRRKGSSMSHSTTWSSRFDLGATRRSSGVGALFSPREPARSASLTRRTSRESLRSIPSPKPAPSISLPSLPHESENTPPTPDLPTPPYSAPAATRPALTLRTNSMLTTSTHRAAGRSHALAALEGRSPNANAKRPRTNFMSLSDDEDDDEFFLTPSHDDFLLADEDVVLPPPTPTPAARQRKRRNTRESWFPLASFIDLNEREQDDVSSWSWRSFVEVASVA